MASFLTHAQAVALLRAAYPAGFAPEGGPSPESRPARWRAAQAAWTAALGGGTLARLVEEGEPGPLVTRALRVEKVVAPLLPSDAGLLATALADEALARPLFAALADLLSVPSPGKARFERLFSAARALPVDPPQQWLAATLFPFLADPTRHVLVRPRATALAAERLGLDVRFQPAPVWSAYSAVRSVQAQLLERLAPEGAADFVDVEAFLHLLATRPRSPAGGAAGKAGARRG